MRGGILEDGTDREGGDVEAGEYCAYWQDVEMCAGYIKLHLIVW